MAGRDKTVRESMVETYHIIRPSDLNSVGRLFGGTLMAWIDEVAVLVGRRHAQMAITTGSIDNLKFLEGAYLQDTIRLKGKVTHVGNTSMEIKVETYVEHLDGDDFDSSDTCNNDSAGDPAVDACESGSGCEKRESQKLINRAYLTLVGLDENDRPARLPRLILETDEDRREWERAEARRQLRKKQAGEGFSFYGD